jgi:hypothetical protein
MFGIVRRYEDENGTAPLRGRGLSMKWRQRWKRRAGRAIQVRSYGVGQYGFPTFPS